MRDLPQPALPREPWQRPHTTVSLDAGGGAAPQAIVSRRTPLSEEPPSRLPISQSSSCRPSRTGGEKGRPRVTALSPQGRASSRRPTSASFPRRGSPRVSFQLETFEPCHSGKSVYRTRGRTVTRRCRAVRRGQRLSASHWAPSGA